VHEELRWTIEGAAQALLVLAALRCFLARHVQPGGSRPWIVLTISLVVTLGRRALRSVIGPLALGPEFLVLESVALLAISALQFAAFGELKRRAHTDTAEKVKLEDRIRELAAEVRCWERDAGGDDGAGEHDGERGAEGSTVGPGRGPGPRGPGEPPGGD